MDDYYSERKELQIRKGCNINLDVGKFNDVNLDVDNVTVFGEN